MKSFPALIIQPDDEDISDEARLQQFENAIRLWSVTPNIFVPRKERLERVFNIQSLILTKTENIADRHERGTVLSKHYRKEQDIAVRLLNSLQFSPSLYAMMAVIAQKTAEDIFETNGPGIGYEFSKMDLRAKMKVLRESLKIYFNQASVFIPGLVKPELKVCTSKKGYAGWVYRSMEELESGKFGKTYLDRDYVLKTSFPGVTGTLCHEATHHFLGQIASLHLKKKINFIPSVLNDVNHLRHGAYIEYVADPLAAKIYASDPEENLARYNGYQVADRLTWYIFTKSIAKAEQVHKIENFHFYPEDITRPVFEKPPILDL